METFSVRQYLAEHYQINAGRKGKVTCPTCQHETLSIKGDDLAKCFHASCGWFLNAHSVRSSKGHFQQLLWEIMHTAKRALLEQVGNPSLLSNGAYRYLLEERKVHPNVIQDSPVLGTIPSDFDVTSICQRYRERIQKEVSSDVLQGHLDEFDDQVKKLTAVLTKVSGWLVFGYTNANHQLLSLKFREPFTKRLQWFKPNQQGGVFNPIPFDTSEDRLFPYILLSEGEFNTLSLQSLLLNNGHGYALAMSLGGSSSVDWESLKGFKEKWILFQDNDMAGDVLAKTMQEYRTFRLIRPSMPEDDLDSVIKRFDNPKEALASIQMLIAEAKPCYRFTSSIVDDINAIRRKEQNRSMLAFEINQLVSKLLKTEFLEAGRFYQSPLCAYYLSHISKSLYPLHKGEKSTQHLLQDFSLNHSETIHKFTLNELEHFALKHGEKTTVCQFAHYDKASHRIYLFNRDSEVFRISVDGIESVDNGTDGVLFEPLPGYKPFERKDADLSADLLTELFTNQVNIEAGTLTVPEYQMLLEGWVFHMFFDGLHSTHTILAFIGPKGSSKTSSIRRLGTLLFGSQFQVCPIPQKPDDFDSIVSNGFLVGFDNVDGQTDWLNDKLAIVATGGTIRKRELYSTNNMIEFSIRALVAITSRTPKFRRDDVAERLLIVPLKTLEAKTSEQHLLDELLQQRNRFMSWLLLKLQDLLKILEVTKDITPDNTNLRMADFATFLLRMAKAEGLEAEVNSVFEKLATLQSQFTLENDPLFELLETVAIRFPNLPFRTADLHQRLTQIASEKGIKYGYASANSLGQKLSHVKTNLEEFLNVSIAQGSNNTKLYTFSLKSPNVS